MVLFQKSPRKRSSGFTIIEILIVLSIFALVVSLGLPAFNRVTYQQINSTSRKMIGLFRSIRSDSILLNKVYRFTIDLDHKCYWVEVQSQAGPLDEPTVSVKKNKKKEKKSTDDRAVGPVEPFIWAEKYSKEPLELPKGVSFDGVLKEREGLVKEGVVYLHFFPNGFNDQAIVYLNRTGSSAKGYSVWLKPTLGQVEIFRTYIESFEEPK